MARQSDFRATRSTTPRRGVGLLLAILALTLIGILLVSASTVSLNAYRAGRNTAVQYRAQAAAEYGLSKAIQTWPLSNNRTMHNGDVVTRVDTVKSGTTVIGYDTVTVTRLNLRTFLLASRGFANPGSAVVGPLLEAHRRAGLLLRLDIPKINLPGAFTTRGPLTLTGTTTVSGTQSNPTGWTCPPMMPDIAGVALDNTTGNPTIHGGATATGSPPITQSPAAADTATYTTFGDYPWAALVSAANLTYASGTHLNGLGPVVSGSTCDTTSTTNWGDPNRATPAGPCESYFPVIYAQGDLNLAGGGTGQGILLVNGDLSVAGGAAFTGLVLVHGAYGSSGTGFKVTGGVVAENTANTSQSIVGGSGVQYSECALETVLSNSKLSYPKPLAGHAWSDLF